MQKVVNGIHIIIFSFVFIIIVNIFFITFSETPSIQNWKEERFNLTINNISYKNIDVDSFIQPALKRGDEVHISRKIWRTYLGESLVFRTYGSAVEVSLNDEIIYSYGENLYKDNRMIGRGYHIIKLNNLRPGYSNLDIKLMAGENMPYMWVDFLKFNSGNNVWMDIFSSDKFFIMISLFMFSLGSIGFVSVIFIAFIIKSKGSIFHILYSFSAIFFAGLWSVSVCGFLQVITNNLQLVAFMEYISLYLSAFFYLGSVEVMQKDTKFGRIITLEKWIYFIFISTLMLLHFAGILFISQSISIFRIAIVVVIAMAFIIVISDYKKQKSYEKILRMENTMGLVLLLINAILHTINVSTIEILNQSFNISGILISIAVLVTITSPLISHIIRSGEIEIYEGQIALLNKIAYKDPLTGLDNRYGARAFTINLEQNNIPYYVIMMDLNDLKTINDAMGHDRGDRLLVNFAECIKSVFNNENCISVRHGGDEFVIVLREDSEYKLKFYLDSLQENIDRLNSEISDGGFISVAIGVAGSREIKHGDYDSVLKLADERMYKYKLKSKEAAEN